jgi:hypothetical protein
MTDTLRPPGIDTPGAQSPATDGSAPKLTRSIGVVGGTLLTLSCLTPASSLFVIVPDSFGALGTGTALTIVVAALLSLRSIRRSEMRMALKHN